MGEFDAAIAHYQAMIDLNPNDNQGIRHVLIMVLLERGQDRDAGAPLKRYPADDTAIWLYSRALLRFRNDGPGRRTTAILQEAMSLNPFVLDYLLGASNVPRDLPALTGIGDETEAIVYFQAGITGWLQTRGAIERLRDHAGR